MDRTKRILKFFFSINLLFLLLLTFSTPFVGSNSGAQVALVLALVPIAATFLIVAAMEYLHLNIFDR